MDDGGITVLASRDSWLSSITLHLICPALHFLQIIISTFTLTKMLNKANATTHVDVCIYLRVNTDLIISSKGRIKKRTFTVMLHNQTAMSVSMLTKGKRYWQEQCRAQYCHEILWSFEQGDSSEISFHTREKVRHMQKFRSSKFELMP